MAVSIAAQALARLVLARNEINFAIAELEAMGATPPTPAPPMLPDPITGAADAGLTDPAAFFNAVRGKLWPKLLPPQVEGCEAILKGCAGVFPASWAAYALATAYHETAYTMQPIREKGSGDKNGDGRDDYLAKYDTGRLAAALGNTPEADGDGVRLAGRGLAQITGHTNYLRATTELRALGILRADESLVDTPDLALRLDVAVAILVYGMRDGWFTSKSLRTYIPATPTRANFVSARRIINGTDRADMIAGYAMSFYAALIAGGWK